MALSDLDIPSREIIVGKGSFVVFGLSLAAVSKLVQSHLADLEILFDMLSQVTAGNTEGITEDTIKSVISELTTELPHLAANIILLAANETDQKAVDNVLMLPAPIQIDALLAVYSLTFEDIGGIKKLWQMIAPMLKGSIIKTMTEKKVLS